MVKNPSANAGDVNSIPESGRFPGEGNGNPLQDSCLENSTDRGAWWATVHAVAKRRLQFKRMTHFCFLSSVMEQDGTSDMMFSMTFIG